MREKEILKNLLNNSSFEGQTQHTDLRLGDYLEELDKIEENSIDSIVTDPPYELNFMGKGWDNAGISFSTEVWSKCLRVLKPRWTSVSIWWK